jgi:Family of unknown function (DUF6081)
MRHRLSGGWPRPAHGPTRTGWPVRVSRLDSRGRPQRAISRPTVEPHRPSSAAIHSAPRRWARPELRGPDLDAARWSPARLPLPTGGEHIALDPNAELAVGQGEVRVTIPRFSLAHSAKCLIFSTRRLELPPDGPATFAVDMAVENIGGQPADYRRGMAAFAVFDIDVSERAFSAVGTSTRAFAMHEQVGLGAGGAGEPFFHVVESPYEAFDDDFTRPRACEITLDRGGSTAAWRVDGRKVYEADTFIPERAQIGFGIWTMLPDRDGRSRSLDGQGLTARWRRFRVRGVDA